MDNTAHSADLSSLSTSSPTASFDGIAHLRSRRLRVPLSAIIALWTLSLTAGLLPRPLHLPNAATTRVLTIGAVVVIVCNDDNARLIIH